MAENIPTLSTTVTHITPLKALVDNNPPFSCLFAVFEEEMTDICDETICLNMKQMMIASLPDVCNTLKHIGVLLNLNYD